VPNFHPTPGHRQTANAVEANQQYAAERAVDDPVKLERAARIIRVALRRGRLSLADLDTEQTAGNGAA
jgi:hypothetical protein